MSHELFGNPITGYTTEFYSSLLEEMAKKNNEYDQYSNLGLIHAKQESYKTCFIPKNLRNEIIVDSKNLTVRSK